jgi:asparagine synthase (glutamine-hydrolysing)
MPSDEKITALADLLEKSILQNLPDKIAVPLSGGLDSSLLATVAAKKAKVLAIGVGTKDCEDLKFAKRVAGEIGIDYLERILSDEEIIDAYKICFSIYPCDFLKCELLVVVNECCKIAKENGIGVLLSGAGAEEAFCGYDKYYRYLEEGRDLRKILDEEMGKLPSGDIAGANAIAKYHGVKFAYPFADEKLFAQVQKIPIPELAGKRSEKKPVLRAIARNLGVPEIACVRPKKAMQYGSGVHKILLKNKKNLPGMVHE